MTEEYPSLTWETSLRASACDFAFWAQKLAVLRSLPGNPYGAEVRQFGGSTTLMLAGASESMDFNRVGNISAVDVPHLDAILDWYGSRGIRCRFDIVPFSDQGPLLRALAERGFYQSGFKSVMFGLPQAGIVPEKSVTVKRIGPDEATMFADMYVNGFGVPASSAADIYLRESVRGSVEHPSMRCLVAFVDNVPAGIGVLYLHGRTGYLAAGATLPAFRGRGCQQALLQERIALAAREGCDLVVGHMQVGSVSQRNGEKVGLRLAYTKALWTPL